MSDDTRPLIFISFSGKADESKAKFLKKKLMDGYDGSLRVFVSSVSMRGGEWRGQIKERISECKALLLLCSRGSILQPWLMFEAGAAYMIGKRVVPLVFGGLSKDALPSTISDITAFDATDESELATVFSDVNALTGLNRVPAVGEIARKFKLTRYISPDDKALFADMRAKYGE